MRLCFYFALLTFVITAASCADTGAQNIEERLNLELYEEPGACGKILSYDYRNAMFHSLSVPVSVVRSNTLNDDLFLSFLEADQLIRTEKHYRFCTGYKCENGYIYARMMDLWTALQTADSVDKCEPELILLTCDVLNNLQRELMSEGAVMSQRLESFAIEGSDECPE